MSNVSIAPAHIARKDLGNTGLTLPEIGLGTWQYEGGVEPLRTGIALGATLVDTAESYGTEEVVGKAIKGIRDQVFLATKISPRHFRRADVIKAAEASLRRLGTDRIDLYQLHWPNYCVPIAETMGALEELVEMGKIRFIGVSNFSAAEIERAQAALSKNKIIANQLRYSLVDRTIEFGLLQYCEARQITVLAFSPLAHGLQHIRRYDRKDVLGQISTATSKTRAQVALNWCVSGKPVIVIVKANQVSHVRENCGASGWSLLDEQRQALSGHIGFKRRSSTEVFVRRLGRHVLQRMNWNV